MPEAPIRYLGVLPHDTPLEVFIIPWTWGTYLGADALKNGADVCVSSWRRPAPDTIPTMAKAGGNYLGGQLSKMQARVDNYVEGIMLDSFGLVSEGSGENLFLVRDGKLVKTFRGVVEGRVIDEPRGPGGFGYDPLFYCPDFGCTFGEATIEQKMQVSHRARALDAMFTYLRALPHRSIAST